MGGGPVRSFPVREQRRLPEPAREVLAEVVAALQGTAEGVGSGASWSDFAAGVVGRLTAARCEWCGALLGDRRPEARTCSDAHRVALWRSERRGSDRG